jgi:hypothetical protein
MRGFVQSRAIRLVVATLRMGGYFCFLYTECRPGAEYCPLNTTAFREFATDKRKPRRMGDGSNIWPICADIVRSSTRNEAVAGQESHTDFLSGARDIR